MSTLPLEVHEVLEEEYRATYTDDPGTVPYDAFELTDRAWARSILCACEVDPATIDKIGVEGALKRFVDGNEDVRKLGQSPAITTTGRAILDGYDDYRSNGDLAARLNRRIVDEAFRGAIKPLRDMRLGKIYAALHAKNDDDARTALCISGGGIRSATFALGVIQGLAGANILSKFHYLSTVSGGGYIGSWLSSWTRRHPEGIEGVEKELYKSDSGVAGRSVKGKKTRKSDVPSSKIDPEAPPVRHLREYSNYLSPKLGITSGDSWTLAALYLRNLLLNLLVLLPILAVVLAIPRFFSLILGWSAGNKFTPDNLLLWTSGFLAIAFGYIGATRPVSQGMGAEKVKLSPNAKFILGCVLGLLGASTTLGLFWANVKKPATDLSFKQGLEALAPYVWYFVLAAGVMVLLPFAVYYLRYILASAAERRSGLTRQGTGHVFKKAGIEFVAVAVSVATSALLFLLVWIKVFPDPTRSVPDPSQWAPFLRPLFPSAPMGQIYVTFAVPAAMLIFFVQASIFVGLSGRINEDDDREWWGRAGAWLLMVAVAVAALGVIAVFGPVFLYKAPLILASLGGLSGVAAAVLGFSAKTAANEAEKQEGSKTAAASQMASKLAVPLFVIIALAGISLGTTWLIQRFDDVERNEKMVSFNSQFTSKAKLTAQSTLPNRPPDDPEKYDVTRETKAAEVISVPVMRGIEHLRTIQNTKWQEAAGILAAGLVAFALSFCIGVNKFSMHALYRNRLIRAYLGASRYTRDPDRFTGFDENDNLQMHELRRELVWTNTFGDGAAFVERLRQALGADATRSLRTTLAEMMAKSKEVTPEKRIALEVWQRLGRTRKKIPASGPVTGTTRDQLILAINDMLLNLDLDAVAEGKTSVKRPNPIDNRAVFAKYGFSLGEMHKGGPLHVINTALNLVSGDKLAWQQRKAESFTVTPLHSGSPYVGYRDTRHYGGAEGISIGTAVTISGAAASPNMGYNSSIPVAFLLTLFNVRLGWWLGNPGVAGRKSHRRAHPWSNVALLATEMVGGTDDQYEYVYLSDGGHFENLGIYEMVLRRCRYIVVSDGGCDPNCAYDDLGNAIRKIRIDLGVPVDIVEDMFMFPRTADGEPREGSYVAKATIRYSAIDGDKAQDGTLIYIKPGLYKGLYYPRDVYNYARTSADFPHEPTSDQFFSESQFESYRALGRHAVNQICGNYDKNDEPYANVYESVAKFAEGVQPSKAKEQDGAKQIAEAIEKLTTINLVRPSTPPPPPPAS